MSIFIPKPATVNTLRMLVIGQEKSGKTHFAASFPNPLFMDFDENLNRRAGDVLRWSMTDPEFVSQLCTARGVKPIMPAKGGGGLLNVYDAWMHFANVVSWIGSKSASAPVTLPQELVHATDVTVVLDSLTLMASAVEYFANSVPDEGNKYHAYKLLVNFYSGFFSALKNIRVPLVVLAHEYRNKETGVLETQVSGQFAQVIGAFFNQTVYSFAEYPVGTGPATFKILMRGVRYGKTFGGYIVNTPDVVQNDYKELKLTC